MEHSPWRTTGLLGRHGECEALDGVLATVRADQSQVLVLRGEAGVGKTVLLDYLVERASGCRVARATGVESEMELAHSGLHQLCAPMLDRLERLPGPQRDALSAALGRSAGPAPDRFLVGLAVLGLLSEVAEERPLICVIDDAQWLDRASAQTLAFVARRLLAEPVGMVFAVREPSDGLDVTGLAHLEVGGLRDDDARTLLDSAARGRLDERLRDRIVAEARGNPLALLELPRGMTPAELAGGYGLPDVMPLASRIEQSLMRQLDALPDQTRLLLLTAAADPVGDVALLRRTTDRLGLAADAAAPAEAAGLIEIDVSVRFRHPLMRSAAYRAATVADHQRVHRALAEETDPDADPDRRAWHRAHAAVAPDEPLALELERSAGRAQARGGMAAAAAFLTRAAELTPDPALRGRRVLVAAQAKLDVGAPETALELLASVEPGALDALQHARMARVRAQIAFTVRRGSDAPSLLLDAARRLGPLDAAAARESHLEAMAAAMFAGRLGDRPDARETAEAARAAPPAPNPPGAVDLLLDGLATRFTEGYAAGVPPIRRALGAFMAGDAPAPDDMRWLWLACRLAQDVWDDELWHELATRGIRVARDTGALTLLPIADTYRASLHVHEGAFDAAEALIDEANAIIEATHIAPLKYASLMLAAWRGNEATMLELVEDGRREATARGEGMGLGVIEWATALMYNGRGRHAEALAAAQRGCEHDDVGLLAWSLVETVEAGARADAPDAAAAALERLSARTRASGTQWALGIEAGSRALLSDGRSAEPLHREAIERLADSRGAVHLARAQLRYGEWLRREGRRVDAREQLRAAHATFSRIGAEAFAERAAGELLATGETVRKRVAGARHELTAQEAQIARLALDGNTNPEIGAQLFISPRTVEYHLHNTFAKLGISSRKELRDTLPVGAE
ncbi:MAG TPA: AAA family ATPase [Baekduia sp.]|uniref:helix-turn-helix transcriptional regulator n=1 Tax=Baekduia sp. TaxID=2600305 RepID=UPI002B5C09A6|nr:AAA family ATPase [Baekduia sp.]HMJ34909.1 AAA family ATPase [Baekduia sp.]